MKLSILAAVLLMLPLAAFAERAPVSTYLADEIKTIPTRLGDKPLGQLTAADWLPIVQRLDIARQEDQFVRTSQFLSFVWPGAGQFHNGDWGAGLWQSGAQVGITAATLVWAHALLPSDLRWDQLNYWSDSHQRISDAWASHSLSDFMPAIGALAVGAVVDVAFRAWSAHDAVQGAKAKIDAGSITFEPTFDAVGRWGMGMGYRF